MDRRSDGSGSVGSSQQSEAASRPISAASGKVWGLDKVGFVAGPSLQVLGLVPLA